MEKGVTAGKEKDTKALEMLYSCSICEHKCQKKITITEHTNAQSMEFTEYVKKKKEHLLN